MHRASVHQVQRGVWLMLKTRSFANESDLAAPCKEARPAVLNNKSRQRTRTVPNVLKALVPWATLRCSGDAGNARVDSFISVDGSLVNGSLVNGSLLYLIESVCLSSCWVSILMCTICYSNIEIYFISDWSCARISASGSFLSNILPTPEQA